MDFEAINLTSQLDILTNVIFAFILGGVLGFEREWKRKPAGLRTNMIIAGASALIIALGRVAVTDYLKLAHLEAFGLDPTRIIHAIVVGVGFLGAGTILKSKDGDRIRYLTTSAMIWMSSAIGITVGLKQYWLAAGVTVSLVVINLIFAYVNRLIYRYSNYPEDPKEENGDR